MYTLENLEELVISFKRDMITDADNWPTDIANEREGSATFDIFFALVLRSLRFDISLEDFNEFLDNTPQEIVDEMWRLDDVYGVDNQTRYEDYSEVEMEGYSSRILCITCAEEILGREITPGDFGISGINFGAGGLISLFCANGKWSAPEVALEISEMMEKFKRAFGPLIPDIADNWEELTAHEIADIDLKEFREWHTAEELERNWFPCARCDCRVWGDSGVSQGLNSGYHLKNDIWNSIWEKWEQIRDE